MRRIFSIALTAFSIGLVSVLSADVLRFENGDQLTGTYMGSESGEIIFLSSMLGEIRVSEGTATVHLVTPMTEPDPVASLPNPPEIATEPTTPVAERVNVGLKQPRFPEWNDFWEDNAVFRWLASVYPLMAWKNRLELGLDLSFAQAESRTVTTRFRTERSLGRTSYLINASYERAGSTDQAGNETRTLDRLQARSRIRRDIEKDKNLFIESSTRYNRDLVTRIYHEAEQTAGVGYRWLETTRWKSSVVGSVGTAYREINSIPGRFGFVATIFQDLRYQLTERISISEESNLSYVPTQEDDNAYLLRIRTQLESRLNSQLSVNLRYEYYFDERVTNPAARTTQGFSISLGTEF